MWYSLMAGNLKNPQKIQQIDIFVKILVLFSGIRKPGPNF